MATPVQHKMSFKVVQMCPTFAAELLKKNHPNNRSKKNKRIEKYAREMRGGIWQLTHEGIAIDEDGWIVDGQNRLEAVIESGATVPMVLITGVPRRALVVTNTGATRNVADAAKIKGVELPHGASSFAGVARRMEAGRIESPDLTIQETLSFIEGHRKAIEFAFECLPSVKVLAQASVRAVIARSYYCKNQHERIKEFCDVLRTGFPRFPKADSGAIRLRNWLLDNFSSGVRKTAKARPRASVVYARTERALQAFLNKEEVEILRETAEELFPIPSDK